LLRRAAARIAEDGWRLVNADCMVVAMEPKLAPHVDAMRAACADALGATPDRVSIRATGTDGLGFTGRGEGIAAQAVVLVERG
ncbi:MAG: 2-C-methyl-D-erythritol 2,4-cyclodiphosphate synthase, partial [Gaiellales bacterium]